VLSASAEEGRHAVDDAVDDAVDLRAVHLRMQGQRQDLLADALGEFHRAARRVGKPLVTVNRNEVYSEIDRAAAQVVDQFAPPPVENANAAMNGETSHYAPHDAQCVDTA
jgi:hypothetical protein